MFTFFREHWVAYLIGAVLALALGFGAAYAVGVVGSTPASVRSERVASEEERQESLDATNGETSSLNSLDDIQAAGGEGSDATSSAVDDAAASDTSTME